jgi:fatty acid desaturase
VTDWFLGGLNYQIEHHLFPNMPRTNLRRSQPMIREYCELAGLPYVEEGLVESYAQALRHLHAVGAPLR